MAIIEFIMTINMIIVALMFTFLGTSMALLSICCIDYLFDFEIRNWLIKHFNRPKKIRQKVEKTIDKIDNELKNRGSTNL